MGETPSTKIQKPSKQQTPNDARSIRREPDLISSMVEVIRLTPDATSGEWMLGMGIMD
jgi:hypothetical protein